MDPRLIQGSLLVAAGYLIGSLPMGVIVARMSGARDPRRVGSGRTGGTNALRAMGARRGLAVTALDVAKGAVPILICIWAGADALIQALTGIAAVLGSCRSLFLRFHGGRGVGAGVGATLAIQPLAVVLAAPVFFVVAWVTRYVSLSSLIGTAACGLMLGLLVVLDVSPPAVLVYAVGGVALIWLAHADSIHRLRTGQERRFDFFDREPA